jgi:hypothetical protein
MKAQGAFGRILVLVPMLGLGLGTPARPEEMALPVEKQAELLLTILPYDRNLGQKAGSELAIGIVYDPGDRDSVKATTDLGSVLFKYKGKTVKQLPFKYYTIEYTNAAALESFVKQKGISVLYIAPGNARNLTDILKLSQDLHLTTLTGVPDYVRRGAAVGLAVAQDQTKILINLRSTKAEGSDFEARLLNLATIVGPR